MNTFAVCATALAVLAACASEPGSPFSVAATPEIRERFRKLCVNPNTGKSESSTSREDERSIAESESYVCSARIFFDPATKAIRRLYANIDGDPATTRQRIERIVLPIVNGYMRELITKHVLSDLGTNKEIHIAQRGRGVMDFSYNSHIVSGGTLRVTYCSISIGRY